MPLNINFSKKFYHYDRKNEVFKKTCLKSSTFPDKLTKRCFLNDEEKLRANLSYAVYHDLAFNYFNRFKSNEYIGYESRRFINIPFNLLYIYIFVSLQVACLSKSLVED